MEFQGNICVQWPRANFGSSCKNNCVLFEIFFTKKKYLYRSSEICKFLIQIWNWSSEWKLYCKISHGFDMRMLTEQIKVYHLFVSYSAVGGASDLKAGDTGFDTRSGIY